MASNKFKRVDNLELFLLIAGFFPIGRALALPSFFLKATGQDYFIMGGWLLACWSIAVIHFAYRRIHWKGAKK